MQCFNYSGTKFCGTLCNNVDFIYKYIDVGVRVVLLNIYSILLGGGYCQRIVARRKGVNNRNAY